MMTKAFGGDALNFLAAALGASGLGLAAWIWRFGPAGPIPVHLDLQGRVNRWGDRTEVALVLGGLTVLLGICYLMMAAMAHRQPRDSSTWRSLRIGRIILLVVGAMVGALLALMTYDPPAPDGSATIQWLPAILSLVFLITGALLGKTSPNPFVGVRTYWSMKSRLAWDKSNRLAGRLFFWIGLGGLAATPMAPASEVLLGLLVAILAAAVLAVIESWRVWRADPDRSFP
jgi:uncharacterized membrane protein